MKKLFSAALLSAALLTAASLPAHADEASKQAKAAKLVDTMHMEKNMTQMMDMMSTQMKKSFASSIGDNATAKQKQIFDTFVNKVLALMQTELSWNVLKPDMVKLYADNFTEQDLDGLIAFYSSPVGQTALEKMPVVLRQSSSMVQAHIATLQPQVQQLQQDFVKQMEAAQPPASAGAGAAHPASPTKP